MISYNVLEQRLLTMLSTSTRRTWSRLMVTTLNCWVIPIPRKCEWSFRLYDPSASRNRDPKRLGKNHGNYGALSGYHVLRSESFANNLARSTVFGCTLGSRVSKSKRSSIKSHKPGLGGWIQKPVSMLSYVLRSPRSAELHLAIWIIVPTNVDRSPMCVKIRSSKARTKIWQFAAHISYILRRSRT